MTKLIVLMLVGLITTSSVSPVFAQATNTSATTTTQTTPTPEEVAKEKKKQEKTTTTESSTTSTSTPTTPADWKTEILFPLLRLLGIAVILGALLWWIDLPELMKGETWTDRTVIALIIIFSFAAASLINVGDKALTALKDVTLIVVGFYFGAAKTGGGDSGTGRRQQEQQGQQAQQKQEAASAYSPT